MGAYQAADFYDWRSGARPGLAGLGAGTDTGAGTNSAGGGALELDPEGVEVDA